MIGLVELALLIGFVLIPPLLICIPVQFCYIKKRLKIGKETWKALIVCGTGTAILSFIACVAMLPLKLGPAGPLLGIQWLEVWGATVVFMPLAWMVVAILAPPITWVTIRRRKSAT